MEKDFEQWMKDNWYSWVTIRIYISRIKKEYKRKGYNDIESFVRGEIDGKQEIYVSPKAVSAFRKFAEYIAPNPQRAAMECMLSKKMWGHTFEVKKDPTVI